MIVSSDRGATLRCTGCDAYIELSAAEITDPFKGLRRKQCMAAVHEDCESYRDKRRARAVIKRRRAAYRAKGATSDVVGRSI